MYEVDGVISDKILGKTHVSEEVAKDLCINGQCAIHFDNGTLIGLHGSTSSETQMLLMKVLTELREVKTELSQAKDFIEKISAEVGPVLDKLQNNSMFKMIMGK